MSLEDYVNAQRSNLNSITRVPEFELIRLTNVLYDCGRELISPDLPPRYGQFLLLAHQSFLSAATLIAQAQPFDAGPVTRRAIEIARVCLASKHDHKADEKWLAFEKRQARWNARQRGEKPPRLKLAPIVYDVKIKNSLMKELDQQHGILSDGFVHFTPEYYASQQWKINRTDEQKDMLKLVFFISDIKILRREFILLAETHARILKTIDHCLDYAFSRNDQWQQIAAKLIEKGRKFGASLKADNHST